MDLALKGRKQLSLVEKFELLSRPSSSQLDLGEDLDVLEINSGNEADMENIATDVESIRRLLTPSEPLQNLATNLRRRLYSDDLAQLVCTRETIVYEFSRSGMPQSLLDLATKGNCYREILLVLEWDLLNFLAIQFEEERREVSSVIILTRFALFAHATLCRDYINRNWPSATSSSLLLTVLQTAVDSSDNYGSGRKVLRHV